MASKSSSLSIVPVSGKPKKCRPFILNVMVMIPEAGYKFEVSIEKACSSANDPIWKLVFDLFKKNAQGQFEQVLHVSFKADAPQEQKGIEAMAADGGTVTVNQAQTLSQEVFPAAKKLEDGHTPTAAERKDLQGAMRKVATVDL